MPVLQTAEKLGRVVQRIRSLPTLPTVYHRVQEAMRDPETSAVDLARIIESDQAIASKVLRLVNSSYFGFTNRITSLRQAVVMLGFHAVRNALLAISVVNAFGKGNDDFDRTEFWKHALAVAATARALSSHWRLGMHDDAYAAGILHDVGKIVLDQYLHPEFMQCLQLSRLEEIPLFEAERRILGVTHCDVGEYLGEKWSLPPKLLEGIALHHRPRIIRSEPRLVALVSLSDTLVRQLAIGHGGNHGPTDFSQPALEELGLTEDQVLALIPKLRAEFDAHAEMFVIFE